MNNLKIPLKTLEGILSGGRNRVRIPFLESMIENQLQEIFNHPENIYTEWDFILKHFNDREIEFSKGGINTKILWIILMSRDSFRRDYIQSLNKDFFNMKPKNDMLDIYTSILYLIEKGEKVEGIKNLEKEPFLTLEKDNNKSLFNFLLRSCRVGEIEKIEHIRELLKYEKGHHNNSKFVDKMYEKMENEKLFKELDKKQFEKMGNGELVD